MRSSGSIYHAVDFCEQDYRVKTLATKFELEGAYAFRHKIFAEELGWVPSKRNCLDIDKYDGTGMVPLGVFDQRGRIVAHLRMTLPHRTFMMEKEFATLIQLPIKKTAETIEVSRVCTDEEYRKKLIQTTHGRYNISMLLYKGLYQWCRQNIVNDMYMVIEYRLMRLLKLTGFPCKKIGKAVAMPDGVSAVAVTIHWREFELLNRINRPHLISGGVTISLTRCWVGQEFRERPPMIRHVCCHCRSFGPEDPICTAAECFMWPDQIVAGYADSELGLQPTH